MCCEGNESEVSALSGSEARRLHDSCVLASGNGIDVINFLKVIKAGMSLMRFCCSGRWSRDYAVMAPKKVAMTTATAGRKCRGIIQ